MSAIELPDCVEVLTGPSPAHSVIWLHGLGADGHDFDPVVPALIRPGLPVIRFVFPHAPLIPVTLNNGHVMRAWYDILSIDGDQRQVDLQGILHTRELVNALIEQEKARGVPSGNIVLAGFSQGGVIAYMAGLSHDERLAGVIGLSTYLPDRSWLAANRSPLNLSTPVFAGHGDDDDVVPSSLGRTAADALLAAGYPLQWHSYPMPHTVCPEELDDIADFLLAVLR